MEFASLLRDACIPPEEVAICLHKPGDPLARRALVVMVEERPDLFEAYQSTHSAIQEATVRKRPYFASFVMTAPGELTFVGLYERNELKRCTAAELRGDPIFCEMLVQVKGHKHDLEAQLETLSGRMRFEFTPLGDFLPFSKRLVIIDPGGRNYVRLAETTPLKTLEFKRLAQIIPPMPSWDTLILSRAELASLPREWAISLAEWRGIYLIVDEYDGARYVGAAYGEGNLLSRWQTHVAAKAGVTTELRKRETQGFRFSILELLSPTASIEEVTAREQNWMTRLHTRQFGLNA